jgi:hypothetical protein
MKDYKLKQRNLRASHTLGKAEGKTCFFKSFLFFLSSFFIPPGGVPSKVGRERGVSKQLHAAFPGIATLGARIFAPLMHATYSHRKQ